MTTSSLSFGQYLTRVGLISLEQLEEATEALVVFGGRLGSNLIELGYLRIEEVEQSLAQHLQVPAAPRDWLEHPSPAALKTLPVGLPERYRVLPLRVDEREIHLAMVDPRDPVHLEDLGFATGMRIRPYVFSEVRASFYLKQHLGISQDLRYINLGPTEARGRLARATEGSVPDLGAAGDGSTQPPDCSDVKWELFDLDGENLAPPDESVWGAGAAIGGKGEAGPAISPTADLATLEAAMASVPDRESLNRLAQRIARFYVGAAVMLVVRGGTIYSVFTESDADGEKGDGILASCDVDSFLSGPATRGEAFRGNPPRTGLDASLLAALGRSAAYEVAVFPIEVDEQVVNLLYVDNGPHALGDSACAALARLCTCIAGAYEYLIATSKSQHC
jgi:hypothetical protein